VILEHFSLEERKEEECKLRDFFHFLVDFSRYFLLVTFKSDLETFTVLKEEAQDERGSHLELMENLRACTKLYA